MDFLSYIRSLFLLSLPLIGGHVAQVLIGVGDTLIVGRYSTEALAALVLGTTIFFIIFIFGAGFSFAAMALISTANTEGNNIKIRRITRMALWLSLTFGCLVSPFFIFSERLLLFLGQDFNLAVLASDYLIFSGIAMFPALSSSVLRCYLAGMEYVKVTFYISIVAVLLNLLINYLLVFGMFGFPELGIIGAGIATVLVNLFMFISFLIYAKIKLSHHNLFVRFWRPDRGVIGLVLKMGSAIGITSLAEAGLFSASSIMIGWLGQIELAAHGIALQLASITFMLHLGLSDAATIRVSSALGKTDKHKIINECWAALVISLGLSSLAILIFLGFPELLISTFLNSEEINSNLIIEMGISLLALAALFQLVDGGQALAIHLLRGLHDTTIPMYLAVISYWIIGLPCGYVLSFHYNFGAQGIWLGLVLGLGFACLFLLLRLIKNLKDLS
ncbi:MAG: MATE family efflux transporter [Paracoccaceae bacterium]|jgi:MATE family multidrug resistance protein|nr:MATE family efflux transporter [Paracoccaceae bacterium]